MCPINQTCFCIIRSAGQKNRRRLLLETAEAECILTVREPVESFDFDLKVKIFKKGNVKLWD